MGREAGLLGSANEDCSAQLASSLSNRDFVLGLEMPFDKSSSLQFTPR